MKAIDTPASVLGNPATPSVAEFVGADRGLGFLINLGRGQYDTALVFVAVFMLVMRFMDVFWLVAPWVKQGAFGVQRFRLYRY